jgi:LAO/AO transport system ATPase
MLDVLLERFRQRDRRALAQLLTLLSRGEALEAILGAIGPPAQRSQVVAITGSGGVGKSTLIGKLIERFRSRGQTLAVLACDPQSPLTGGAILGDRFRMGSRPDDDGLFIRSLAAASGRGALAEYLSVMVLLVEAFGFDRILVETVGAGQGDTAVRYLADVVVLLLQPETGDELQWEKAGLLEVADLVVVHKADLPTAERTESQVRAILDLTPDRNVPILRVSAASGQGVDELARAIEACPPRRGTLAGSGRDLLGLAEDVLRARLAAARAAGDPQLADLLAGWQEGRIAPAAACAALLRLLAGGKSATP